MPSNRTLAFAKDGFTISDTNPDNYNLWLEYPPLGLLEKKTTSITVQGGFSCSLGIDTQDVAHDYDFFPLVIGEAQRRGTDERFLMPMVPEFSCAFSFPVSSSFITYRVYADKVQLRWYAACALMGFEECPDSDVIYDITLYFYLWELGSVWPQP